MRDRQSHVLSSATVESASQWAPRIILLSLVVILVSTLYPFKFVLSEPSVLLGRGTSRLDLFANVVLFIPLGFGLASALTSRKYSPLSKLLAILFLGGGLSLAIEILQTFLPDRDSTLSDVVTNTMGAGVGYGLFIVAGPFFYQWVPLILGWVQALLDKLKLKYLIAALLTYAVLAALLALSWQKASLHSWEIDQPLSLGSKVAVQRPEALPSGRQGQTMAWKGTVSDLLISDRALSQAQVQPFLTGQQPPTSNPSSILALYSLKGNEGLQDRTGQSPKLVWQSSGPAASADGVQLSEKRWLVTADPVSLINQRIQTSGQFALSATISASELNPSGFPHPPILAISPSSETPVYFGRLWNSSNIILSQVRAELVVRMRISRTGWDRAAYTAQIPAVFLDTRPHQIYIRYAGFMLQVEIDGQRSFLFDTTPNRYQIVFYVLVLMPLALLISLVANRLQSRRLIYLALVAGGAVLPALVLESLLVSEVNRSLQATNVLLGFLIMGGTILALKRSPSQPGQNQD